jgi:hypothetical protein
MVFEPDRIEALLRCPLCGGEMRLRKVEPESEKRDLYTFECERCDRTEVRGARK